MPTKVLTFWTPQHRTYQVRLSDGAIRGMKNQSFKSNWTPELWYDNWKLLGIRHTKRTNDFISFDMLVTLLESGERLEWLYKTSRNPQWTVEDRDYGTRRTWGNTRSHGIAGMFFEMLYEEV